MSKAEEKAMEAYPVEIVGYTTECRIGATPRPQDWNETKRECYKEGYYQAEKDVIERACRWLLDNYDNYFDEDGRTTSTLNEFMVGDFRKSMEEGL